MKAKTRGSRARSASVRFLRDGIGDTIRVSLTEDSPHEIPVAKALIDEWSENVQPPTLNPIMQQAPDDQFPLIRFRISGERRRRSERDGVKLGGEELIRVVVRQANFDKIAHKIDRMGDYKPEIVYENANVIEVDPRDDAAIAKINAERRAAIGDCERRCRSSSDRGVSVAGGEDCRRGIRFCSRMC